MARQAVALIDTEARSGTTGRSCPVHGRCTRGGQTLLSPFRLGPAPDSADRGPGEIARPQGETTPARYGGGPHYDRLILAHGGEAYLPGILAGPPARGIFPVRNLTTRVGKGLAYYTPERDRLRRLACGGKTAVHLRQAGFSVSIVVRRGHILLRALSPESAAVIEDHLREMGIRIAVNSPSRYSRRGWGHCRNQGRWRVACGDTLFVAAGTAPDIAFLEGTDS